MDNFQEHPGYSEEDNIEEFTKGIRASLETIDVNNKFYKELVKKTKKVLDTIDQQAKRIKELEAAASSKERRTRLADANTLIRKTHNS